MTHLRVALCQLPAFDLPDAEAALAACLDAIDAAARAGARLAVLPECAYPAYLLDSRARYDHYARPRDEIIALFADRARKGGLYVAVGLAIPNADNVLVNAALLVSPAGELLVQYAKTFLWHFDRRWFSVGGRYPIAEIDGVPAGLLICADARQPEVARSLATQGARLLLDSTAWVAFGRTPADLQTGQIAYFTPARAIENGAWVLAADKVGVEAETLMYAGRSGVIDPTGVWRAQASPDRAEVLVVDIDVEPGGPPVALRPALYADLLTPTESTAVDAALQEALVPRQAQARIAVLQAAPGLRLHDYLTLVRRHGARQAVQDAGLLVVPDVLAAPQESAAVIDALCLLSREIAACPAVYASWREPAGRLTQRVAVLVQAGAVLARHAATHAGDWEAAGALADRQPPVIATPAGRVGLLIGAEGLVPELARGLMLRGADTIAWSTAALPYDLVPLARARADENRVYVAAAAPRDPRGGALIVDPAGTVVAAGLLDRDVSFSQQISIAAARIKTMAPGTDVLANRLPGTYRALTR